jgi:hypothetical protein
MALRNNFMMKTARKEESGYTNCHMSSGGSGLSSPKPQDKHHSSSSMALKLSCRTTSWVEMYNEGKAHEARQLELDSVEEARCTALVQSARYLQGIWRYHDHNMRERSFNIGDLVLLRIQDESGLHKLNSRWECSFVIKQVTRPGSY